MLFKYSLNFHQVFLVSYGLTHGLLVERWGRVWFSILAVWIAFNYLLTFLIQLTSWTTSLIAPGSHILRRVLRNIQRNPGFLWTLRFVSFHMLDFLHGRLFNFFYFNRDSSDLYFLKFLPCFGLLKFNWSKLSYWFIRLHQCWVGFLHLVNNFFLGSWLLEQFIFIWHEGLRFFSLPLVFKWVKTVQKRWINYLGLLHWLILIL